MGSKQSTEASSSEQKKKKNNTKSKNAEMELSSLIQKKNNVGSDSESGTTKENRCQWFKYLGEVVLLFDLVAFAVFLVILYSLSSMYGTGGYLQYLIPGVALLLVIRLRNACYDVFSIYVNPLYRLLKEQNNNNNNTKDSETKSILWRTFVSSFLGTVSSSTSCKKKFINALNAWFGRSLWYCLFFSGSLCFIEEIIWNNFSTVWFSTLVTFPGAISSSTCVVQNVANTFLEPFFVFTDFQYSGGSVIEIAFLPWMDKILQYRFRLRSVLTTLTPVLDDGCTGIFSEFSINNDIASQAASFFFCVAGMLTPFVLFQSSRELFNSMWLWLVIFASVLIAATSCFIISDLSLRIFILLPDFTYSRATFSLYTTAAVSFVTMLASSLILMVLPDHQADIKEKIWTKFIAYQRNRFVPDPDSEYDENFTKMFDDTIEINTESNVETPITKGNMRVSGHEEIRSKNNLPKTKRHYRSCCQRFVDAAFELSTSEAVWFAGLTIVACYLCSSTGFPITNVTLNKIDATPLYPAYADLNDLEKGTLDITDFSSFLLTLVDEIETFSSGIADGITKYLNNIPCFQIPIPSSITVPVPTVNIPAVDIPNVCISLSQLLSAGGGVLSDISSPLRRRLLSVEEKENKLFQFHEKIHNGSTTKENKMKLKFGFSVPDTSSISDAGSSIVSNANPQTAVDVANTVANVVVNTAQTQANTLKNVASQLSSSTCLGLNTIFQLAGIPFQLPFSTPAFSIQPFTFPIPDYIPEVCFGQLIGDLLQGLLYIIDEALTTAIQAAVPAVITLFNEASCLVSPQCFDIETVFSNMLFFLTNEGLDLLATLDSLTVTITDVIPSWVALIPLVGLAIVIFCVLLKEVSKTTAPLFQIIQLSVLIGLLEGVFLVVLATIIARRALQDRGYSLDLTWNPTACYYYLITIFTLPIGIFQLVTYKSRTLEYDPSTSSLMKFFARSQKT